MLISVRHVTRYLYAEPVSYSVQSLRLTPAPFKGQRILEWQVAVSGVTASPLELRDGFGNTVHLVTINAPHRELTMTAAGLVETENLNGIVAGLARAIPPRVYLKETPQTRPDAAIRTLAQSAAGPGPIETLHALSAAVRDKVEYVAGATDAHTGAAEALGDGKGVCQDHAHIFIAAARTLGIPARYVTGYLVLDDPPADAVLEPAPAHHAWAEAHVEGLGWIGFDVANRICPTDRYVRLACGLDAAYTAPITGSRRGGAGESFEVSVAVQQQQSSQQ
jgi:transglutaminase-like putative cysteine protease